MERCVLNGGVAQPLWPGQPCAQQAASDCRGATTDSIKIADVGVVTTLKFSNAGQPLVAAAQLSREVGGSVAYTVGMGYGIASGTGMMALPGRLQAEPRSCWLS